MPRPELSIVIVNFNSGAYLEPNVRSLLRQSDPDRLEIVVVDCASPLDQTPYLAFARELGARVIEASNNLGYSGGCNLGLAETSSPLVAFSNADVEHVDGTLAELSTLLEGRPDVAITTPFAFYDTDCALRIPNFHPVTRRALVDELWRAVSRRHAHRRSFELARSRAAFWRSDGVTEHENLHGAFLMARRETMERLGGFDAGYPLYYEDTDLFVRARRAGLHLTCQHTCRIVHRIHRSSGTVWHEAMQKLQFGRQRYMRQHLGPVSAAFDRIAQRVITRFATRRVPHGEDLGDVASPPTWRWSHSGEEWLFELSFEPHFFESAGHFATSPEFTPSAATWRSIEPGTYFARALALPDLAELSRWRFTKTASESRDGSGSDGNPSGI